MKNNEIGKTASFGVIHVKPIDKILKEMYLLENNCVYFICLFKKKTFKVLVRYSSDETRLKIAK